MASVTEIASRILTLSFDHPIIRIGIDGFCAAGKTSLARALELELRAHGRTAIRACADDFQNPPTIRYQLGDRSAEGFYRHAMDFGGLRRELLEPLGPGGSLKYLTSIYDVHASRANVSPRRTAVAGEVLLLDGLFLHVPELDGCFEFTVYVNAEYETCITRARSRNQERVGDADSIEALYRERYVPGFQLYVAEVEPRKRASVQYDT